VRFFRHAKLYPVDALIGGFRKDKNSRGLKNLERCHEIHRRIVEEELSGSRYGKYLKVVGRIGRVAESIPKVRRLWGRLVTSPLYGRPGRDWAPVIRYDGQKWVLSEE
jgi:hypothetical protein